MSAATAKAKIKIKHRQPLELSNYATVAQARRAHKKTWRIVEIIVDDLLSQTSYVRFHDVYRAAMENGIKRLRMDLIPCSLMGAPYMVDCETRMIYRK